MSVMSVREKGGTRKVYLIETDHTRFTAVPNKDLDDFIGSGRFREQFYTDDPTMREVSPVNQLLRCRHRACRKHLQASMPIIQLTQTTERFCCMACLQAECRARDWPVPDADADFDPSDARWG